MPTVFRWRNCRFYFYSHEGNEPPHVHVDCAENTAKFWLDPVAQAYAEGFNSKQAGELLELVEERRQTLMEAWHDHFR